MLKRLGLSLATIVIALGAALYPRLRGFGLFRGTVSLNNQNCITLKGKSLDQGYEFDWRHARTSGSIVIMASHIYIESRTHWLPAVDRLNASVLSSISTDHITILSLAAPYSHHKLKITGLPQEARGIWVHGIDIWQDPSDPAALTLYLISHRPPRDRAKSEETGADSVVEIFETRAGDDEVRWVKTVKHNLVITPNAIAAVGPRTFYVSNDHSTKTHWMRKVNDLYTLTSDIVYCDASGRDSKCKVAVNGLIYPNGLTLGTNGLIYSAPTFRGGISAFKRNKDHTLHLVEDIKLEQPFDNLHTDAESGHIYGSAFTQGYKFAAATKKEGIAAGKTSPVEAWKFVQGLDGKHTASRVFGDPGQRVSATTSAAPFGDKIFLTGVATPNAFICTIGA
ncbi:hypothetical protein FRB97_000610 [Tulasnella sp. 331]|nr:hypothetical protein FRB97_000610 [Tulasnella sp. 331]KAG8888187.1 hypothetical protein FRB98_008205 [Tulasnella sp. 332]